MTKRTLFDAFGICLARSTAASTCCATWFYPRLCGHVHWEKCWKMMKKPAIRSGSCSNNSRCPILWPTAANHFKQGRSGAINGLHGLWPLTFNHRWPAHRCAKFCEFCLWHEKLYAGLSPIVTHTLVTIPILPKCYDVLWLKISFRQSHSEENWVSVAKRNIKWVTSIYPEFQRIRTSFPY